MKEERMRFLIDLGRYTKFISEFSTGSTQIWYLRYQFSVVSSRHLWLCAVADLQRPETIPFSKKVTFPRMVKRLERHTRDYRLMWW